MNNNEKTKYKVLYVGSAPQVIDAFNHHPDLINYSFCENVILAIDWLSENKQLGNQLDVIICEVNLPGISGFEMFNHIKRDVFFAKVPFILVHHKDNKELRQKTLASRIDDLYITPLNINQIHTRIKYLIKYKPFLISNNESENNAIEINYSIPKSKRIFDIIFASILLTLSAPILLFFILLIKLESKGPAYYVSKRVGSGYKIFSFYKLRSMKRKADESISTIEHLNVYNNKLDEKCPECEKLGHPCSPLLYIHGREICENLHLNHRRAKIESAFKKFESDPRITKVGSFIRKTSIDELPQLINVIKGDMSIVGIRPLPLYEAELLTSDDWSQRFMGPAGLTGLWQVKLKNTDLDSSYNRKKLDNFYAKSYSFWGDIEIIIKTIPAMLQKEKS